MKNLKFHSIVLTFLIIQLSCSNPTAPPPPVITDSIVLKQAAVSCTEAFIKVTAKNISLPVYVTLNKDDKVKFKFTLSKPDTVIVDDSLQPGETHIYQTSAQIDNREQKSDTIQVKTLNQSSDNFIFYKYYFGNLATSAFYDCVIISPNDIWCVGVVSVKDTNINGFTQYNAVHWDGSKWELKQINFSVYCNQPALAPLQANTIFAFNDGQIWVSSAWVHLAIIKEGNQTDHLCLPSADSMSIMKIWGTSSNDFYVVGLAGRIAHYVNGNWQKVVSPTDWGFTDIWGDTNPFTNQTEIICGAGKGFAQHGTTLVSISGNTATTITSVNGLSVDYNNVWFKAGIRYYAVGNGLFEKRYEDTTQWVDLNKGRSLTSYYMSNIRGTDLNNIVVVGSYGEFLHYDGLMWKSYRGQTILKDGVYYSVAVKGNIVVASGEDGGRAVILLGRH